MCVQCLFIGLNSGGVIAIFPERALPLLHRLYSCAVEPRDELHAAGNDVLSCVFD